MIEIDVNDHRTIEAVELFELELVVAPCLRRAIPAAQIYESNPARSVISGPAKPFAIMALRYTVH
ncbi:hypothetical protein [Mesorhizobium sp. J8]|uniref:hypothetical protein n=1 Tax=Mesorhizobium sp. J8 TaxID=2777475 RepID=UPI00191685F0|nr:hypothetical protein [Mesorhizobium sp. J8]